MSGPGARVAESAVAAPTAVAPSRLMRACDCGRAPAGPTGSCAACAAGKTLGPAAGVRLGPARDAWELEADRVADQVVAGGPAAVPAASGIRRLQRQPVEEEEEELIQTRAEGGIRRLQRQPVEEEDEELIQTRAEGGGRRLQRQPVEEEDEELIQTRAEGRGPAAAVPAAAAAVAAGGRPLGPAERAFFEPRFDRDLSHVRLHTDARAGEAARHIGALAYTLGHHIAFAPGHYRPGTASGRHLIAHELTHTLQQTPARARPPLSGRLIRRQPNSLGAIAAAERRRIQVSPMPVTVPAERVTAFFSRNPNGRHGETQTIGGTRTVFGAGIDAGLQTGLTSIGAWLANSTNALPMNMTIEVELDLSAHGGARRRYRFTRFTHRTGSGRSATATPVLLVEDTGPAVQTPAQSSVPSTFTIHGSTYRLSGTWSAGDYAQLHQAVSLLPPAARTASNGLTFRRRSGNAGGSEAGHYDSARDTVELFDNSFATASVRFGGQPASVRNILHEIGHALDLRPLEAAWQAFNNAGQSAAARRTFLRERSPSGTRWVRDAAGDYHQRMQASDRSPAFRRAARSDGVRDQTGQRTTPEGTTATLTGGVTTYSDTDYQELYAESFMLYVTAPDTLRDLRPDTFAFFRRRYPRGTP